MTALSELAATTYEYRTKKPMDAVSDNIPLTYMMKKKGMINVINGGREIWEDIRYAQNSYVQSIDPTEEFTIGYNQTITGFQFSPKIILVPIVISDFEKAQNQGESQFLDLFKQRQMSADDSLQNVMEEYLQGDGTLAGGKAFAGIKTYISTTPSTGTIGGLDRATYTSIRNLSVDLPTTLTGATDASNIESRLRYCRNAVTRNGGPELLLAGSTYYNAGADAMSAKQRFTQNQDMLEANFDNYMIENMTCVNAAGKVFSALPRIAADRAYGIRIENFSLKMYKKYNFEPVQDRVSLNQLVEAAITVGIGQFTTNGPGLSFVAWDS